MAKSKPKNKPASMAAAKPLKIDPKALEKLKLDVESLPEDEKAVLLGMMLVNPKAALMALEKRQEEKTLLEQHRACIQRASKRLMLSKKHKPAAAPYVGKAMAVLARVNPKHKDCASRPTIFGVFASRAASGVLQAETDYKAAIGCALKTSDKELLDRASRALVNPLNLLFLHALIDRVPPSQKVGLAKGMEAVFDDANIKWPPRKNRSPCIEPS